MPNPQFGQYVRVSLIGTLGTPEIFETSFKMAAYEGPAEPPSPFVGLPTSADQEVIATSLGTLFGSGDMKLCSAAKLVEVKFAPIGLDGAYTGPAAVIAMGGIPGNVGDARPPQTSLVTSWYGDPGVRVKRGRMFWPMPWTDLDHDTLLEDGSRTNPRCNAVEAMLLGLTTVASIPFCGVLVGAAYMQKIRKVGVTGVIETQRRRNDQLDHTPVTAEVPYA